MHNLLTDFLSITKTFTASTSVYRSTITKKTGFQQQSKQKLQATTTQNTNVHISTDTTITTTNLK
jgi:hypothetical protein